MLFILVNEKSINQLITWKCILKNAKTDSPDSPDIYFAVVAMQPESSIFLDRWNTTFLNNGSEKTANSWKTWQIC